MKLSVTLSSLGFFVLSITQLSAEEDLSVKKLVGVEKQAYVEIENIIQDEFYKVGEIIASYRPANYLSNDDIIYLSMRIPVSAGDRFSLYKRHQRLTRSDGRAAYRFQIIGNLRITEVTDKIVVAKIYGAKEDIAVGTPITNLVDTTRAISPNIPEKEVRGTILSAAEPVKMAGSFLFSFIDRGSKDGLRLGDKLFVFRKGGSDDLSAAVRERLPEVNFAELVVVDISDHFATVYTLSSTDRYEAGDKFKSAIPRIKFLDDEASGPNQQGTQVSERPTQ